MEKYIGWWLLVFLCLQTTQAGAADRKYIELSPKALEQHPKIVYQGLVQSLIKQDIKGVEVFLPIYQRRTGADPDFGRWAKALRARIDGQYPEAIKQYRWLIARYPDNQAIRLQLAMTLFDYQDNEAAERQFHRLRSGQLTSVLERLIDGYLQRIRERDFWSLSASLSYVNETNVNNAPPEGTIFKGWKPALPESARGFSYGLSAEKTWSHTQGLFSAYRFAGDGRWFWNNHKYDELSIRNSLGFGYRDNQVRVLVLPFFEHYWYGGGTKGKGGLQYYAMQHGLQGELRWQLGAHWQMFTTAEYGVNRYQKRQYLTGDEYRLTGGLVYFPSPKQYWLAGLNYLQQNTRDRESSFDRQGVRVGWGYEWPGGISSRVQLSYGNRLYRGKDFFGIRQKNDEYSSMVTLWHRGLYFWGVTPKISWLYQQVDSNHPFYDLSKHRVFLHLSKDF